MYEDEGCGHVILTVVRWMCRDSALKLLHSVMDTESLRICRRYELLAVSRVLGEEEWPVEDGPIVDFEIVSDSAVRTQRSSYSTQWMRTVMCNWQWTRSSRQLSGSHTVEMMHESIAESVEGGYGRCATTAVSMSVVPSQSSFYP